MRSKVGRIDTMEVRLKLDLRLVEHELRSSRVARLQTRAIIARVDKENARFEAILERMGVKF